MTNISYASRRLTLPLAQHLIATGRITKQELVSYCHALAVAGEERWSLNAFTRIFPKDFVMEQAAAEEEEQGATRPLSGIPISVKANVAVREVPLTASSKILSTNSDDASCGYDAEVVRQLKNMGAIVIGVTQMDEFGMGSLGTNLGEGVDPQSSIGLVTKNPLQFLENVSRIPDEWVQEIKKPYDAILASHIESTGPEDADLWYAGGSSCGSAASVSHGSSLLSVASDTGGSIRLPAAWCGIVGFKPAYGCLSRKGLVSYASSLDTVGILTPTAECASVAFDHLQSAAAKNEEITDSTMVVPDMMSVAASNEGGSLRVGIPSAFSVEGCPKDIVDAWEEAATSLEQSGATLVELPSDLISPELIRHSLAAYYILASAEASSNLSRYDGLRYGLSIDQAAATAAMSDLTPLEQQYALTRSQGFGREVVRRILSGTSVLSSDRFHTHYEAATKVRAMVASQFRQALQSVDVLLTPTCLALPNKNQMDSDPTAMFANDVLTVPVSLASLPAVSVPWQDGTPIGLQIVGASDSKVLEVAATVEKIRISKQTRQ